MVTPTIEEIEKLSKTIPQIKAQNGCFFFPGFCVSETIRENDPFGKNNKINILHEWEFDRDSSVKSVVIPSAIKKDILSILAKKGITKETLYL